MGIFVRTLDADPNVSKNQKDRLSQLALWLGGHHDKPFVGDVVQMSEADMLKIIQTSPTIMSIPSISGDQGTLDLLKKGLADMGLGLGMTIPGWSRPPGGHGPSSGPFIP